MADERSPSVIPGPSAASAEALLKSHPHVVDRVVAPEHRINARVERYRLRKSLLAPQSPERDAQIRKSAELLSPEDRERVCDEVDAIRAAADDEIRKSQQPQRPASSGPTVVALGVGDAREMFRPTRGAVVNFDVRDQVLHGRILRWTEAGAIVASPDGEFAVKWTAARQGFAEFAKAAHDAKTREAKSRTWSALLTAAGRSPEQIEEFMARRGLAV